MRVDDCLFFFCIENCDDTAPVLSFETQQLCQMVYSHALYLGLPQLSGKKNTVNGQEPDPRFFFFFYSLF